MTSDEKMLLDSFVNMTKSMNRIADELKAIREVVTSEHRQKVSEARRARVQRTGVLVENMDKKADSRDDVLSKKTAMENIHDIIEGAYIR